MSQNKALTYPLDLPGDVVPFDGTKSPIKVKLQEGCVRKGQVVNEDGRGPTTLTLECPTKKAKLLQKHLQKGEYPVHCQELPDATTKLVIGSVGGWRLQVVC